MNKFANAIANAAEIEDVNEATVGGDFKPLAAGPCLIRFVSYIELGKHKKVWQGTEKTVEKVKLGFEVSGPKIEPRDDGLPHVIYVEITKSQSERAAYYKLFRKMNIDGKAKVFGQLLGNAYRGTIVHNETGEGEKKRTYANLTDADGAWQIFPTTYDDVATGETKEVTVPEAKSALQCFLWAFPDKEQWDSIFIDGEWEAQAAKDGKPAREARSKNINQIKIKSALNWVGSPMQELLFGDLDIGGVEKPERSDEAVQQTADAKAAAAQARANAAAAADPLADDSIPF